MRNIFTSKTIKTSFIKFGPYTFFKMVAIAGSFHFKISFVIFLLLHFSPTQSVPDIKKMFNESIFNELSWTVKLLLLKDYFKSEDSPGPTTQSLLPSQSFRRMPGVEYLMAGRRQEEEAAATQKSQDDDNMRMKLFRLMYETIRDSDLKCKRAELIRSHYANSSVFEIGYLMGDVMDKFNIMSDISNTMTRLFHEWKPIEHINAYEQISNQAIEINHLIDLMKNIGKKNETS